MDEINEEVVMVLEIMFWTIAVVVSYRFGRDLEPRRGHWTDSMRGY